MISAGNKVRIRGGFRLVGSLEFREEGLTPTIVQDKRGVYTGGQFRISRRRSYPDYSAG
jgi:hypothetical protein